MMVKRPLYYFLNVSNFFNYLTAILAQLHKSVAI